MLLSVVTRLVVELAGVLAPVVTKIARDLSLASWKKEKEDLSSVLPMNVG